MFEAWFFFFYICVLFHLRPLQPPQISCDLQSLLSPVMRMYYEIQVVHFLIILIYKGMSGFKNPVIVNFYKRKNNLQIPTKMNYHLIAFFISMLSP